MCDKGLTEFDLHARVWRCADTKGRMELPSTQETLMQAAMWVFVSQIFSIKVNSPTARLCEWTCKWWLEAQRLDGHPAVSLSPFIKFY